MTLTDTQLLLLSTAAQRTDLLLLPPQKPGSKAALAATAKLLRNGLIVEVTIERDQPHWREEADGQRTGFQVTPSGLQAIGIEPSDAADPCNPAEPQDPPFPSAVSALPSRPATKKALVRAMLEQEGGTTLQDLTTATGWLPHTTRACLTRLRQAGAPIIREAQPHGLSTYRIASGAEVPVAIDEPAHVTA